MASKLKIVRAITDLPPACYRLSTDGRKWKSLCEARQKLANWLALKANPDGTKIYPGIKKMVAATGWKRSKVFYVLDDLKTIGCVINEHTRVKHGQVAEHGTALRRFDPAPLLTAHAAIQRNEVFTHPDTRKGNVQDSEAEIQDSPKAEVRDSKPKVHDSDQQSRIEDQKSNARVDTTVLPDRPNIPTNQTDRETNHPNLGGRMVGWLCEYFGQQKKTPFLPNKSQREKLEQLAVADGEESFQTVCRSWIAEEQLDNVKYPPAILISKYDCVRASVRGIVQGDEQDKQEAAKSKREAEWLAAAMERDRTERQKQIAAEQEDIRKQREFEAATAAMI